MSKAKEKRAARKAYEKKLAGQFPDHNARAMKRACAELGFHHLRREYQVQCNAGTGETWHLGVWRYLWNEFVPDVAPNATWDDAEQILRAFESMLAKDMLNRQGLIHHILQLGRIGA
mgnify:CR=1 FL=1